MEQNHINIFDKYLRNELSPTERQQFEHKLENDPELKAAFQEHQHLIDNIQNSARLETLKMIQGVQNDFLSKKGVEKGRILPLRKFISIAAIFLIAVGIGFGVFYFSKNTISQNNEIVGDSNSSDEELVFGGSSDVNLLFERKIQVFNVDSISMSIIDKKQNITIKFYENKKYDGFYKLSDTTLTIFSSQFNDNDLDISAIRLNNDQGKLYLKFGQNGQWYFFENNAKSQKLKFVNDLKLFQKLHQIPGK